MNSLLRVLTEKRKKELYEIKHSHPLKYPEVYIPFDLYYIFRSKPALPSKLYRPSEPIRPSSPRKPLTDIPKPVHFISIAIILLMIVGIVKASQFSLAFLVVFIAIFFLTIPVSIYYLPHIKEQEKYANELNKYKKELERYDVEKERYLINLAEYEKNIVKINAEIAKIQSVENTVNHRKKLFKEKFNHPFDKFTQQYSTEIKKGVSEPLFYRYMKTQLNKSNTTCDWMIFENGKVLKTSEDDAYYPDYVVVCDNLIIDIEIDEPYVYDNKKPIHYQYSSINKNGTVFKSIDEERDTFFTDNNWCVIRFAEEQIFKEPYKCFLLVKKIAESIISCKELPDFENEKDFCVLPVNKWSETEAQQMAADDYRDTYINAIFDSL
ncbi:MAG: hypothetical protein K6A41_10840 [Bacteroidales bacterium]|nr:hypothetical protein [Bacteroidales bacterium]